MTDAAHRAALAEIIAPAVNKAGFDLEDFSIAQAGRRSILRIVIDSDSGVSLDDVATVSSAVSTELDADPPAATGLPVSAILRGPYTLEVTSPGVDRPLTLPRHWQRNTGRLVRTTMAGTVVVGRVRQATEESVLLDVEGQPHEARYDELSAGTVQVEFDRKEGEGA